jgi:4-hydroxybutyrate dehydrogenase
VPTTFGTGSEVTNIAILQLKAKMIKMDLATDELYADSAVIIPELLQCLPFKAFATSSICTLSHAIESYLSPRATEHTRIFSMKAIEIILRGLKKIVELGRDARRELLNEFLLAGNYSGIAFGNIGCLAIHAMSYPLSAIYNVPYGEANHLMFTEMFTLYQRKNPNGEIKELNKFLAYLLECDKDKVCKKILILLNNIIIKKSLSEYEVIQEKLDEFTDSIMEKEEKLMDNNYIKLDRKEVYDIYKGLYYC